MHFDIVSRTHTYAAQSHLRRQTAVLVQQFSCRRWPLRGYALLSLLMTWPLAARLGTAFPSDTGSDMLVHEWTLWYLRNTLLNLQNPFTTDLLAHPSGVALTSHNIAWMNFGVGLPLALAFGQATATSLTYLAIFTFNAYAMYLFAFAQTGSRASGWVAGLIFGFFPVTLSDGGHVNMLITGWLPLALLYLQRVLLAGGWRNAFFAGLFFALLGISRWQLLAMAAPLAVIFVLFQVGACRRCWRPATLGWLAAVGGVMLLVMAPLLLPLAAAQLTRESAGNLLIYEPAFSADLLGYVVPHFRLDSYQWLIPLLPANLQFAQQEVIFLGYTVLLLVLLAAVRRFKVSAVWLLMAALLGVLALGPVVTVGGHPLDWLYTPYRLIEDTFLNRLIRKPWRYNTFLGLPLAMLGALGVGVLRRASRRKMGLVTTTVSLLILAEFCQFPFPMMAAGITPAWYQELAADPEEFAIVGMPISSRWADKFYMYYQMEHGKPMVGGHVSRPPVESIEFMVNSPFLYDMLYQREMDPALVDVTHQLRYLADANVRYVILHKNFVAGEKIAAWKDWLTIAPVYEDDLTVVYRTAPQAGVDFHIEQPLTAALGVLDATFEPAAVQAGDPLTVDVRWGATAAVAADYDYCVNLVGEGGAAGQQECQPISPDWPTGQWQANEVARSLHTFRVDPFLPAGSYRLVLSLRHRATGEAQGDTLEPGAVQVNALPRQFTAPAPQHPAGVRFGDDIQLHGYDLDVRADNIALTLYWQADRRLERTYKVFVHAVDATTGVLLAQVDAAPRNWAYPTTWWEAGEVVDDPIMLSLGAADQAHARLEIGLYDEATGERLPLAPASPGQDGDTFSVELH